MTRLKGWIFKQNPICAGGIQLSNEKRAPGCLGYIGDYTTQLCRGFSKPQERIPEGSLLNNQDSMESKKGIFVAQLAADLGFGLIWSVTWLSQAI